MYYYVYKITFADGHYYIGKHRTNDLNDGYNGSGYKLKAFYKQHPDIQWVKEIICYCKNKGELSIKESELIGNLWKSDELCLNLTSGSCGNDGRKFTEEQKKLISERTKEAMKNVPREKLSHEAWNKGRTGVYSEETIKKFKEAVKRRPPVSDESRKKMSKAQRGKKLSEETKRKISENNPMKNPEVVKKMVAKNTGKKRSEEYKKKMSILMKGKPGHPAWNKGLSMDDETKKKISESTKKAMKDVPKEVLRKGRLGNPNWLSNNKNKYGWKINPETGKREWYLKDTSNL